jgi:hypothetical protein
MENILTPANEPTTQPYAPDSHVTELIRLTEQQLRQLMEERRVVTKRIRTVKQTIVGLANLFGNTILGSASFDLVGRPRGTRRRGITRACRQVLLNARRPMTAREVRDTLQLSEPALLDAYKDALAAIHTILGRLVTYGEATVVPRERGQRAWLCAAGDRQETTPPGQPSSGQNH